MSTTLARRRYKRWAGRAVYDFCRSKRYAPMRERIEAAMLREAVPQELWWTCLSRVPWPVFSKPVL